MMDLITEHIDIWTSAQEQKKKGGRGRGKKSNGQSIYGIKKLRELILELAVQGKLVAQDPDDEPVGDLLKRIREKKTQLIKEGKFKRQKKTAEIAEEEKKINLPSGWDFSRVSDFCVLENGDRGKNYPNKSALVDRGIPFINAGHLKAGKIDLKEMSFVSKERYSLLRSGKVQEGDILYCLRGSLGKTAIVEGVETGAIASSLIIIRIFPQVFNRFILSYFDSPLSTANMRKYDNGTAQPNLPGAALGKFVVPIPPLAEQHRIVAKVDELMALCDKLEQQQTDSNATHQTLVETLLTTLTNAADQAAFADTWQRIADHFDTLFTTEQSIDHLKQTILQLAVMGKLVPQNPDDEPASVLLEKIAEEKVRLIKDGKIKRLKALPEIVEDEKQFRLPKGWCWARLQNAIDVRDGTHDSPKDALGPDIYPLITSKNFKNGEIVFEEARRISAEDHHNISKRSLVEMSDILFSMVGGNLGNQVMVLDDRPFSVKNVALFKYYDKKLTSPFFIKKFLEHLAIDLQAKAAGGAQPFVSLSFLRKIVIAIPPIEEQHRIVAKVDELMALCDTLKASLSEAQTTQVQLADTIVEQATN